MTARPSSLFVTGGGRGIGRAVALRFAREGGGAGGPGANWGVTLFARSEPELAEAKSAVEQAGGQALAIAGDVAREEQVEEAVRRAVERFGAVDVLVNNAGVFRVRPLLELESATWRETIETNLSGAYFATRAVVRAMLAQAERSPHSAPAAPARPRAIVNVSSEAGKKGFAGSTAYCASKYGLLGFGDALREELKPHGIRVINVLPGQVDTRAWDDCGLDLDRIGIRRERMMRPSEVADTIAHAVLADGAAVAEEILIRPL